MMRLICPNCGAQYDVPDGAVPPAGREVQCSSCSHTWFEIEAPDATQMATPQTAAVIPPEFTPAITAVTPPDTPLAQRRPIDETVKAILREEAARDRDLIASAPPPATVAPDPTAQRIAQIIHPDDTLTAETPRVPAITPKQITAPDPATDDMPSMDDINARLRGRSQAADDDTGQPDAQDVTDRRGFRRGFALMLLIFAVLFAPYIFADQITAAAPQLRPAMDNYVAIINQFRINLNQAIAVLAGLVTGA